MADRLSAIEQNMYEALGRIDGTLQSTGYTYYSNTGTIQVYDEGLSLEFNDVDPVDDYKSVNHIVQQQEDIGIEVQEWSTGQKALTTRVVYEIQSRVHNFGDELDNGIHPKNSIRIKMNQVINDLLFVFNQDYQLKQGSELNGRVNVIRMIGAYKMYEDNNDVIQSGTLVTQWEVLYNQSFDNPDLNACW